MYYSADAMSYDVIYTDSEKRESFPYFLPQNCYGFEEHLTDCPQSGNSCPSANPVAVSCSGVIST